MRKKDYCSHLTSVLITHIRHVCAGQPLVICFKYQHIYAIFRNELVYLAVVISAYLLFFLIETGSATSRVGNGFALTGK